MKNEVIPLFLTIDDGFAKYTSVMIRSIIENAALQDHYKIWIIHRGLTVDIHLKYHHIHEFQEHHELAELPTV